MQRRPLRAPHDSPPRRRPRAADVGERQPEGVDEEEAAAERDGRRQLRMRRERRHLHGGATPKSASAAVASSTCTANSRKESDLGGSEEREAMSRQETRNGWSGNSRARAPMSEAMFAEGGIARAGGTAGGS